MAMTRRDFIRAGVASATALWAAAGDPFFLFASRRDRKWTAPAEGRIGYASGQVLVNGKQASSGDPVKAQDLLETGPGAEVDVEMRDYSIFHLKENSSVEVADILSRPSVRVKRGWFLIIVKRGTPMDIRTPTVLAGVRGTVLFLNVREGRPEYFCNCAGSIELGNPDTGALIRSVKSSYHKAYHLSAARGAVELSKAGLLYHDDEDILRMAGRFSRETNAFRNARAYGSSGGY
jgi:ferric-dicitrate binding protein FerR (iron transport regulator)